MSGREGEEGQCGPPCSRSAAVASPGSRRVYRGGGVARGDGGRPCAASGVSASAATRRGPPPSCNRRPAGLSPSFILGAFPCPTFRRRLPVCLDAGVIRLRCPDLLHRDRRRDPAVPPVVPLKPSWQALYPIQQGVQQVVRHGRSRRRGPCTRVCPCESCVEGGREHAPGPVSRDQHLCRGLSRWCGPLAGGGPRPGARRACCPQGRSGEGGGDHRGQEYDCHRDELPRSGGLRPPRRRPLVTVRGDIVPWWSPRVGVRLVRPGARGERPQPAGEPGYGPPASHRCGYPAVSGGCGYGAGCEGRPHAGLAPPKPEGGSDRQICRGGRRCRHRSRL